MAYVSFGLDRGAEDQPDLITLGTDNGGGGNNVTLCMDQAVGLTRTEVLLILDAFKRKIEDGRYAGLASGV